MLVCMVHRRKQSLHHRWFCSWMLWIACNDLCKACGAGVCRPLWCRGSLPRSFSFFSRASLACLLGYCLHFGFPCLWGSAVTDCRMDEDPVTPFEWSIAATMLKVPRPLLSAVISCLLCLHLRHAALRPTFHQLRRTAFDEQASGDRRIQRWSRLASQLTIAFGDGPGSPNTAGFCHAHGRRAR